MPHKTAEGTWRVRFREKGKRRSKNFRTKGLAESFEAKLRIGAEIPANAAPRSRIAFGEFSLRWLEEYCRLEKAETQHREDESVIQNYLNPAFGKVRLSDLGRSDLHDLKVELSTKNVGRNKRPLKPKSVNNVITLAKTILQKAVEWELLGANPFQGVKPVRVPQQPFDYWTIEERDRFIRFARVRDPAFTLAVEVAVFTGLRLGELAGLRRGDIDLERRTIVVGVSYSHKLKKGLERTKSGRREVIPMTEHAYEVLKAFRFLAPAARLFPPELLEQAVRKLKALCAETGTRAIRFHDLRHTFASCAVMSGVDLYTVQKLMRHASVKMTQRYAHLSPDYMQLAVRKIAVPDLSPMAEASAGK